MCTSGLFYFMKCMSWRDKRGFFSHVSTTFLLAIWNSSVFKALQIHMGLWPCCKLSHFSQPSAGLSPKKQNKTKYTSVFGHQRWCWRAGLQVSLLAAPSLTSSPPRSPSNPPPPSSCIVMGSLWGFLSFGEQKSINLLLSPCIMNSAVRTRPACLIPIAKETTPSFPHTSIPKVYICLSRLRAEASMNRRGAGKKKKWKK